MNCPKCKSENIKIFNKDNITYVNENSPLIGKMCCQDCGKLFDESDFEREKPPENDLMEKIKINWGKYYDGKTTRLN